MTSVACILQEASTQLWGLSARERLKRQFRQIGGVSFDENTASSDLLAEAQAGTHSGAFLLIDANFLFEPRTLSELLGRDNTVLCLGGRPAAAVVQAQYLEEVSAFICADGVGELSGEIDRITTADLNAFDDRLRRSDPPLLELVSDDRKQALESKLYGNSYKGVTDLITKWAWPRPARYGVKVCASLGISPNMVTSFGFLLVIVACYLFLHGYYAAGLLCGWIMTFLDTVDGKLARVTIQSSPFGHFFDHGIDLIHPPFWYYFWGVSLIDFGPVFGFTVSAMVNWIIGAYIAGRIVEGLFQLLGSCGVFTWRPFDAWVRLITARRNPCLIILTVSVLFGVPAWGFVGVFLWTVLSSVQLLLRLLHGLVVRMTDGPLSSWLADAEVQQKYAGAYAVFGGTRAAYKEVDDQA